MTTEPYDIAVIGAGPGGYIAALKAGQMGARTVVIEKGPVGGTCLNVGCIPSKALLASADLMHHLAHAKEMGVELDGTARVNWATIQGRKDRIIKTLRGGVEGLFKARKVDLLRGTARLTAPHRIALTDDKGAASEITAKKVLLAVGSTPSRIPGWPTDTQFVCTSDEALHWSELPRRLLIVGGGVIGAEFACMMQPLGVQVTVVEMLPRLLPNMEPELGNELAKVLGKRGIAIHVGAKVDDLRLEGNGVRATLGDGTVILADKVLVATGRRPATGDLGLDAVGLTTDRGFLRVNERMETPLPDHYCIGDANGRCLLAHAASAQGVVAVENALGHSAVYDAPIPEAVYTFPEVAAVGLTTERAREKGIPLSVGTFPMSYLGKAMAANDTAGFVKVLRHRETHELVGVHMMGHNVTECIAAAGVMLHEKLSVRAAAEIVMAHPTMSETLHEGLEDALGAALHLPPRKVLRVASGA